MINQPVHRSSAVGHTVLPAAKTPEEALLSRDVIGQAKGILMERLRTTPDEAFEILKESSQRLNVKLREVARRIAETGELKPGQGSAQWTRRRCDEGRLT